MSIKNVYAKKSAKKYIYKYILIFYQKPLNWCTICHRVFEMNFWYQIQVYFHNWWPLIHGYKLLVIDGDCEHIVGIFATGTLQLCIL